MSRCMCRSSYGCCISHVPFYFKPQPTVRVWLHGGEWASDDREIFPALCEMIINPTYCCFFRVCFFLQIAVGFPLERLSPASRHVSAQAFPLPPAKVLEDALYEKLFVQVISSSNEAFSLPFCLRYCRIYSQSREILPKVLQFVGDDGVPVRKFESPILML